MPLPRSTIDDYAQACRREGQSLVKVDGIWWKAVRPFFYRPVIPFSPACSPLLPARARWGAAQYASQNGAESPNSLLHYLAFTDAASYRLESLKAGRRWEVRSAQKRFRPRVFANAEEFKATAHPVYVAFHRRSRYEYLAGRVQKEAFDRWSEATFSDPGLIAIGLWTDDGLGAASLSRIVDDTWIYSSFFSTTEALREHSASLMLHHVRELAAGVDGIRQVFGGMRKNGESGEKVDAFYLHRGAQIVSVPTVLRFNPLARWLLARVKPSLLKQMQGNLTGAASSAVEA
jgi:hypothetical protein